MLLNQTVDGLVITVQLQSVVALYTVQIYQKIKSNDFLISLKSWTHVLLHIVLRLNTDSPATSKIKLIIIKEPVLMKSRLVCHQRRKQDQALLESTK